jgi:hypothetical protein
MSVGGAGKEGDVELIRTGALSPSFLTLGGKRQGSRDGISQDKTDKTEDEDYEYNITSFGKK